MVAQPKLDALNARLDALTQSAGGGWLGAAREDALGRLKAVGLPHRRDEYWRYTDPSALVSVAPAAGGEDEEADPFDEIDCFEITIEDGEPSWRGDLPEGIDIGSVAQEGSADIHWARDIYGVLEAAGSRPVTRSLAMLNTAFATDGLLLHVHGTVDMPIHIRYVGGGDPILHHCVKIDSQASVTLLESGYPGARFNTVMEVDIADGGACDHIRIQGRGADRHANTHLFARLGSESAFKSFTLSQNGTLTRNEAVLDLTGDDASAHVAGAAIGANAFHHDDTVFVTHGALNCESRQVFKKVLRDGATGVFQGKILVKEGAQKTDGYQISQSLLLDDDSVFLAKPELEIYADDVACSHGSTTGAIDETALFYLRSRGVPRKDAEDLLVLSFLAEAVEEIADEELRQHVTDLLEGWLRD
ncbi:SufB/SufD family protein [Jannaschia aquimarina]|uniref:SufD protein n=1 Tax=Jannaschia aquimarina TaxID=935700 RepID=A0A0D1ELR6_9RHOB|nr:SufD family Fe-S cluster assembly protein [Jannaschia aquimarina]KIT17891.1 FeS cluster assembly protein SufD [Jannaschia aquimarina]SNT13988.1 Fe-S cluster assembly protein SufD [Jannaschia aquimarina]